MECGNRKGEGGRGKAEFGRGKFECGRRKGEGGSGINGENYGYWLIELIRLIESTGLIKG